MCSSVPAMEFFRLLGIEDGVDLSPDTVYCSPELRLHSFPGAADDLLVLAEYDAHAAQLFIVQTDCGLEIIEQASARFFRSFDCG